MRDDVADTFPRRLEDARILLVFERCRAQRRESEQEDRADDERDRVDTERTPDVDHRDEDAAEQWSDDVGDLPEATEHRVGRDEVGVGNQRGNHAPCRGIGDRGRRRLDEQQHQEHGERW